MKVNFYIGKDKIPLESLSDEEREKYLRWLNDQALRTMGYEPEKKEEKTKTA